MKTLSRDVEWNISTRQWQAWQLLTDDTTEEILYGGAAGGGKSFLICAWLTINCIQYPGSRWLLGRAVLKNLKESTLLTFFDLTKAWGFKKDEHYVYNSVDAKISWINGSEIYLKDLFQTPSDPNFDSLGSTEYTGAALDEASEITDKAKNIVKSRLRYKLNEFKSPSGKSLIPKMLIASNPAKNWMYNDFFIPWKSKTLPKHRAFVPALVYDNPYIPAIYIETLKGLDRNSRARLLDGDWSYDDDPAALLPYDAILDLFTNTNVPEGKPAITADLAMQGRDLFVVGAWSGMRVRFPIIKKKADGREIEMDLRKVIDDTNTPRDRTVVDSDGLGNYLESYLRGIVPFRGGAKALKSKEFKNLKSECGFKFAELAIKREIYIICEDPDIKQRIIQELEQLKRDKLDQDTTKKVLVSKEDMKENLRHSPDFLDVLLMRMLLELQPSGFTMLSDPSGVVF